MVLWNIMIVVKQSPINRMPITLIMLSLNNITPPRGRCVWKWTSDLCFNVNKCCYLLVYVWNLLKDSHVLFFFLSFPRKKDGTGLHFPAENLALIYRWCFLLLSLLSYQSFISGSYKVSPATETINTAYVFSRKDLSRQDIF